MPDNQPATTDQIGDIDVLVIGAGLSGIDAAYHLGQQCPNHSLLIFEARDAIGGTWDLFRYPGIRSDSDMNTLGFPFHPWRGEKAIADGPSIRAYIAETAQAAGIDQAIRFRHRVTAASWSSTDARWTISYEVGELQASLRCRFLYMGSGYYDYERGHSPEIAGSGDFKGRWVHPQQWPEDLDCAGKTVVVIGSGATAVTLVPALAARGAKVTMLQRSPSYIVARPARDTYAQALHRWLPQAVADVAVRWKNVVYGILAYGLAKRDPQRMRNLIMKGTRAQLPDFPDLERHFTPRYDPWDQRLCLVPDADLFRSLRNGAAQIVTDSIDRATPNGLKLQSGGEIQADVIVTATGLRLKLLGGVAITVDGVVIDVARQFVYRGMMLSGVPNLVMAFGYTNASWTLKIDLVAQRFCRMLKYMDRHHLDICVPRAPGAGVEPRPMLDFNSGYVQRGDAILPRQGSRSPWRVRQNYFLDMLMFRFSRVADGVLAFGKAHGGPA
jgi:monooxygenase